MFDNNNNNNNNDWYRENKTLKVLVRKVVEVESNDKVRQ